MRDFHLPGRSSVFAANGACATSHPEASLTAIDILRRGGNAADAAIAAALVLGIAEPQMTGIGGDLFALISPADGSPVVALNGSGRAPAGANADALRAQGHDTIPVRSADAVTIPGAIAGFAALSDRFGRLPLADLLEPAIRAAEDGIAIGARTAFDWQRSADALTGAARDWFLTGGAAPAAGTLFRATGQAKILRQIARDGAAAFYEGEAAEDMVRALRDAGGAHEPEDFAACTATWHEPIDGPYHGTRLIEHPPNGQGATALLMAAILAHFDLAALDPLGAQRAHLEAEAAKLAYDARNRFLADAETTTRLEHMLDLGTAASLAGLIDPNRAMPAAVPLTDAIHRETVTLSVVDRDRMAVSLIYSIFHDFGSGIASPDYGILLHNRGAGFSLVPDHPNELAGGKRPMHTIIPAMLAQDGQITMAFGVMGGAYQPNGHARVLTNMIDYGMSPQAAIDAPRSFADGGILKVERGYSEGVCAALAEKGHSVEVPDVPIGGAQAVRIDRRAGMLEAASDPRKDGCALGY